MIIDLTQTLQNGISVFPGTKTPSFEQIHRIETDGFAEIRIDTSTHIGTHIDAPCHILPNTKSLDNFPMEKFIGKGMVIDCRNVSEIKLDFLKQYKTSIESVDFVLFYLGWQEKWSTSQYLDDFPVLTVEATEWLLQFNLKAIGFDAFSVDKIDSLDLPNHHLLLAEEVLIIENLTNLNQLIEKSFVLNCIPLKIKNADASPVRAFAVLE